MGKKVRISEQNLHNIIKESVKQCLTELDWKTYMNAARKRQEQGKGAQSQELENYAQQQFQQQHQGAFDDVNFDGVAHPQEISGKTRYYTADVRRDGATTNMNYTHSGANTYDGNYKTFNNASKTMRGYQNGQGQVHGFGGEYTVPNNAASNGEQVTQAANRAENDINTYYSGNAKYIPKQGWANESISRIIRESIRKVVNEAAYRKDKVYIVFDGTSHYEVPGCDVEWEIQNNDAEVVAGPFDELGDETDAIVRKLNDQCMDSAW